MQIVRDWRSLSGPSITNNERQKLWKSCSVPPNKHDRRIVWLGSFVFVKTRQNRIIAVASLFDDFFERIETQSETVKRDKGENRRYAHSQMRTISFLAKRELYGTQQQKDSPVVGVGNLSHSWPEKATF